MADLFFPQLQSGALAQYPIRKSRITRTVRNQLADGTFVLYPDPNATQIVWQLTYGALGAEDIRALQDHFTACQGRLQSFTFIDPTGNMLAKSTDLPGAPWQVSSSIQVTGAQADPEGGPAGFSVTNTGSTEQQLAQTLAVPASYQYCFSLYVQSATPGVIELIRSGPNQRQADQVAIGPQWKRVVSAGRLADQGTSFSVGITLAPGQQIAVYGPQLEGQRSPSRYRPTTEAGGVYANAHWAADELPVSADAPNLFSTAFSITTAM